jgi:hypothetical protein
VLDPSFAQMMTNMCCVLEVGTGGQHMSAITNKLIFDCIKQHYALTTRMQSSAGVSRPARPAISATRTNPKPSPLRRGIAGWRLRCTIRRRLPPEMA